MEILTIAVLILLGLLFCVVELLIFPGVTLGGIISVVCSGSAIYIAFRDMGVMGGVVALLVTTLLGALIIIFSLRAKTWDRFSLKSKIDSTSSLAPESKVELGQQGVALSRLSPMGTILIEGATYEAKSIEGYIEEKAAVEVVGFDNFSVVVKQVENK